MTTHEPTPAIQELKTRAEILQHRIEARDPAALDRLRVLQQFRRSSPEQLDGASTAIRRTDCLTVIAAELGFANWPQLLHVISGSDPSPMDFGTLLCPKHAAIHLNGWYRTHEEAARDRASSEKRRYLLAYRHQFLVVDRYYIADTLRLDPDDPDWEEIGFDWARPKDPAARARLYAKLIARLPPIDSDRRPLGQHR